MKVMVVDDETSALENMEAKLKMIPEITEIRLFDEPEAALAELENQRADIAFLDVEMYGMNGIILAKRIKEMSPDTNIIFVTGFAEYMRDAFSLHVSGYLMKPVSQTDLEAELENLRHPVPKKPVKRVRIQTFGNFEIYLDEIPMRFSRSKAKEALAYLVDRRGAMISVPQLAAVLYEDKPYDRALQKLIQVVLADLKKTLKENEAAEILHRQSSSYAVNPKQFQCDAYDFTNMIPYAVNSYRGEYMANYGWSEFTTGMLSSQFNQYFEQI